MAEPVTTTTVAGTASISSGAVTGIAIMTFFAGLPADVVLGAFAGAILFVTTASEYGLRSRLILALGSFIAGITMYKPAAALVIVALPATYDRGADAAGALLAAGCVLGVLMGINKRNAKKKGGDDADNP